LASRPSGRLRGDFNREAIDSTSSNPLSSWKKRLVAWDEQSGQLQFSITHCSTHGSHPTTRWQHVEATGFLATSRQMTHSKTSFTETAVTSNFSSALSLDRISSSEPSWTKICSNFSVPSLLVKQGRLALGVCSPSSVRSIST